ncbi:MAG: hypothetical protein RL685_791 [Pseudomonadota bacterium]
MSSLAAVLARLPAAKRALLARKLRASGTDPELLVPIPRAEHAELSFAQERLWFLERLQPGLYNMPFAFRVRGELKRESLKRAVTALVERHEALRLGFGEQEGKPVALLGRATEGSGERTSSRRWERRRERRSCSGGSSRRR